MSAGPQPDLRLRGGRILNVFTGELLRGDVLVGGGEILEVGPEVGDAPAVLDLDGAIVLPGFVESHLHIESSLLTPARLAEVVVPRGTTTIVADPHEIANVLGLEGVRWMLRATEALPLHCLFTVPSCVPASPLDTAGATLDATAVAEVLGWDRVVGLAEVMDVPGVVAGRADVLAKIAAARRRGRAVDGHAPGLAGHALAAYARAGIESDHESAALGEAREKLRLGLRVMIRQGSLARNLRALLPVVDATTVRRCLLVSDDRVATDLVEHGHVDALLREAVALGCPALWAVQMVTLNAAEHFGLRHLGAVAPGWAADLAVVEDLSQFRVTLVLSGGRLVARAGRLVAPAPGIAPPPSSVRVAPLRREALRIRGRPRRVRAIGLVPGQLLTEALVVDAPLHADEVVADPDRDLAKLVVVERHRASGRMGVGLVRGFGLRAGALASSVAHDSHNLIAVGIDDDDILTALESVVAAGGGLAAAARGRVLASVPLEVAGLMTDRPAEDTARNLRALETEIRGLGVQVAHPLGVLSFLALPVIPALRLTDLGLVDVTTGSVVPVAAD